MRSQPRINIIPWFRQQPDRLIFLLLCGLLVLGALIVADYGASWDDEDRYMYGLKSLSAYVGGQADLADEKGAFFSMMGVLAAQTFKRVIPGWITMDGWHFTAFLSFLLGLYFFFRLCRRWVETVPALAAVLLFGAQPLVWGHAFINPKDTPFMAFFLASVSLGMDMLDHQMMRIKEGRREQATQPGSLWTSIAAAWKSSPRWARWAGILCLAGLTGLAAAYPILESRAAGVLSAESGANLAQTAFSWIVLACAGALLLALTLVTHRIFPTVIDNVFAAGCFLGFCTAIRTLGPASAALVVLYGLAKYGKDLLRAWRGMLKYLITAALVSYTFWPYLWGAPIRHYLASLVEAQNFAWEGQVLFQGTLYSGGELPAGYFPTLITLQLTEPALILIAAGLVLTGLSLANKRFHPADFLLLAAWFLAPLGYAAWSGSTVYDNFRQFLFVIPVLFIIAAQALQGLWSLLKQHRRVWYVVLVAAALSPGVYWIAALHPYEYIYYNSLAGNVSGAFRSYELDYWRTSYKEAAGYINQAAPADAPVVVTYSTDILAPYLRADLDQQVYQSDERPASGYAILSTRQDEDLNLYLDQPVVYRVMRGNAVLAVVKKIGP